MTADSATPAALGFYAQRAKDGYGLMYPDGHVIRFYEHVLRDWRGDRERPTMLDFGCWTGTHSVYFASKGFVPFGVDIVEDAVRQARERLPEFAGQFHVIDDATNLEDLFDIKFDLIFCNQVLYFPRDPVFERRLREFRNLLAPGGMLFATMISRHCFYSRHTTGEVDQGLEIVKFDSPERLKGKVTAVRFTKDESELRERFKVFSCRQVGRYECDLDLSSSTEHFIYVGK